MKHFTKSGKTKAKLTFEQNRRLRKMYEEISQDIAEESARLSNRTNVSSILRQQYLDGLSKQVKAEVERLGKEQDAMTKGYMARAAQAVIEDSEELLLTLGINAKGAFSHIPTDVVERVASGKLYADRWNLSQAIWGNTQKTKRDIDTVVAKGIAEQKSTFEIAKDLEDYVNPRKRKGFEWAKVYPGTAKVVDYNAQRLARTMLSHAYEDALIQSTKDNPFIECYEWLTSNSDRVCEICQEREAGFHGVVINGKNMYGCYYAEDIPLDHPNGMCTIDVYIEQDYTAIADRLANWVNGKTDPEIDKFAESLGYSSFTLRSKVLR